MNRELPTTKNLGFQFVILNRAYICWTHLQLGPSNALKRQVSTLLIILCKMCQHLLYNDIHQAHWTLLMICFGLIRSISRVIIYVKNKLDHKNRTCKHHPIHLNWTQEEGRPYFSRNHERDYDVRNKRVMAYTLRISSGIRHFPNSVFAFWRREQRTYANCTSAFCRINTL